METSATINNKPHCFLAIFKDEEAMRGVIETFNIAIRAFQLSGSILREYVPYLTIASSPFYLYHAFKESKDNVQFAKSAVRTRQYADFFFWFSRGINSIGSALSDLIKPFAGGAELAGLTTKNPTLQIAFSWVIPIVLIVSGAIGGIAKTWAFLRTKKDLKLFNEKVPKQYGTVSHLNEMMAYLKGPQEGTDLEKARFKESHFTNHQRRESVLNRVANLQKNPGWKNVRLKIFRLPALSENVSNTLIQDSQQLLDKVQNEENTPFDLIDETLGVYKRLLDEMDKKHELYAEISKNNEELVAFKEEILREGKAIIGTVKSEIYRRLLYHSLFILMAALTVTAGVLILQGHYARVGYILSLVGSGINIGYTIFERTVSQESFYKLYWYLEKKWEDRVE